MIGQTDERSRKESPDHVIGSLGDALAGVSINNESYAFDGNSGSSNGQYSGQYPNSNGGEAAGLSWGEPSLHSGFPGANSMPGMGRTASADQSDKLLTVTGGASGVSYSDLVNISSESTTPASKQGLELFLSQSPSKTLGGDLLKLNVGASLNGSENQTIYRSTSAFSLDEMGRAPGTLSSKFSGETVVSSSGDLRQVHDPTIRRKSDSPSCSVTGTSASSRSASPYDGDNRRTIQAFGGTELGGSSSRPSSQQANYEVNRINSMPRSYSNQDFRTNNTMHQGIPSDYGTPYGQGMEQIPTNQHVVRQQVQQPSSGNTPQVLYMAVPTPDGRGQMLQPVQMVQLQGQPSAFVLPQASGAAGSSQPAMMVLPGQSVSIGHSDLGSATAGSNWSAPPPQYSPHRETSYSQYRSRTPSNDYLGRHQDQALNQRPARPHAGEPIASLTSAVQRPPLDELLGNVRRLSRDQVGCRLLQQALDEEGPMAATMILNEGLPFWGEAMVDPFGNYLFQKILEKITPEERVMLIKNVSARLVNASLNLHGTRSVQKVVDMCAKDQASGVKLDSLDGSSAEILTRSLAPAAARLCIDSHGNHVIQRILLKLDHRHATFVFNAVAASVGDVARHRHGCCVIQRCLDSPPSEARSHLVHRIVEKSLDLMQDAYGNYVVQYVLDVCEDTDVHAVCDSVVGRVSLLAIQKFSSNVMEKCLERCTDRTKEFYVQELSDPDRIRELMMDPFGNYVVQRALSVASHAQAVRLVEAMRPHLISSDPGAPYGQRNDGGMRNTAGGRRIMAKICRRFPYFSLNENATPDELYCTGKSHARVSRRVNEQVHVQQIPSDLQVPGLKQQAHYGGDLQQQANYGGDLQRQANYGGDLQRQANYGGDLQQQGHYGSDLQHQAHDGGDSHGGRSYGNQNGAYFEAAPPGYYGHLSGHASYQM